MSSLSTTIDAITLSKVLRLVMSKGYTIADAQVYHFSIHADDEYMVDEYTTKKTYFVNLRTGTVREKDTVYYFPNG